MPQSAHAHAKTFCLSLFLWEPLPHGCCLCLVLRIKPQCHSWLLPFPQEILARREIPTAGVGATSSSWQVAAGQSWGRSSRPPFGPSSPPYHGPSLPPTSPPHSRWPVGEFDLRDTCRCSCCPEQVFTDFNPDSTGKGWPAGSGCPDQPILAHQGFIAAENGLCWSVQGQGTSVGSWGWGCMWGCTGCFIMYVFFSYYNSYQETHLLGRTRLGMK